MKERKVFSRKMALYLRQRGFKIIYTEPNTYKPQFDVYIFEDTKELQDAMTEYTNNL